MSRLAVAQPVAFGFLQTNTTTQRINLAVRRMKDATEETGIPKTLDVEVRKFATKGGCGGYLVNERRVMGLLLPELGPIETMLIQVIMTEMAQLGSTHLFRARMEGKTSVELGVELVQLFNIMYSCTDIVNVHPKSDGTSEIPNLMEIYVKTETGIWMSKLMLDGK